MAVLYQHSHTMKQAKTRNLYQRDGVWYYLGYHDGKRIRRSTKCSTLDEAMSWVDQHIPRKRKAMVTLDLSDAQPFVFTTKFISDMYYRMKSRFPGQPVMTRQDLVDLIQSCGEACQVTGIKFTDYTVSGDRMRKPFIPSIDRIDSKKPYTVANCRIVCLAANLAMNEWGQAVFDLLASARIKLVGSHRPHGTALSA